MQKSKTVIYLFLLTAALFISCASLLASSPNPMRLKTEENTISIYKADAPVLEYAYNNVPFKPYVKQLFTPNGINVLRDAPHDHLHHHGLMFAVFVDNVNFWEEQCRVPGRQLHQSFSDAKIDGNTVPHKAGFTEHLDWLNSRSQKLLLKEHRTIEVSRLEDPAATILTWQSTFELPPDKQSATLAGRAYFGLGIRFLESMDTGGQFLNADGKVGVEGTNNLPAKWCAYSAKADGHPVTIAIFDHPSNPRHPATWFTMKEPFAYLSATLNLHNQSLELTEQEQLTLRYAVALWDGQPKQEQIKQLYKLWLTMQ